MMSNVSTKIEVESFTVTTAPTVLAEYDVSRTAITIVNRASSNSIYVDGTSPTSSSFEIKAGESLTLNTRAKIWAVGAASEAVDVIREFV